MASLPDIQYGKDCCGLPEEDELKYESPPAPPPAGVAGAVMADARTGNSFESPKSVKTICPSAPIRMFSGFKSR